MKKLLALFLLLPALAFGQTASTYYTVPTVAALKALTTRPAVVQTVDANPGVFNWSTTPCSAADDIFQVTPTAGPTGCYTRMATPYALGKSAAVSGVVQTDSSGVPFVGTKGTSVNNPGTNTLEYVLPVFTATGSSKTYGASDLFKKWRRSNSSTAMTDTLPSSGTTGMVNGTQINIVNVDSSATITLSAGSGTTLCDNCTTIQPNQNLLLTYDAPNTTWRSNANSALAHINTPPLPGEFGVRNINYSPGEAFRYGWDCNGTTDFENIGYADNLQANAMLPGVRANIPACYYASSFNSLAYYSGMRVNFEPGAKFQGIIHTISRGPNGQAPSMTCTLSAGAVNSLALKSSTVTISIASPAVITWASHGLSDGTAVVLTNSGGALPTGITDGTTYFVFASATNTFELKDLAGNVVNTSGSQSGTQTATTKGTGYFKPARVELTAAGGGNILRGVITTQTYEADYIGMLIGGTGYAVNDTITDQDGTVYTVRTVSAGGVITSADVTTRVAIADPSANAYYNRKTQSSTSGSGTGFYALVNYRFAAAPTVTNAGSGGGSATCVATAGQPVLDDVTFTGKAASYTRWGVQNVTNGDFWNFTYVGLNDTTIYAAGNAGVHFDSCYNCRVGDIEQEGGVIGSGTQFWAAVTLDSNGGWQNRALRIHRIHVKAADMHAVALCNVEVDIDEIVVEGYGFANSNPATRYCGPATSEAAGILAYRSSGYIGLARVSENDQLIGTNAQYGILIPSTGLTVNGYGLYQNSDNLFPLVAKATWGLRFGNVFVNNASRKGGFVVVDKNNADNGAGCSVSVAGQLQVQPSMSTSQTSGYQLVAVNSVGNAGIDPACELFAGSILFPNTGAAAAFVTPPAQPDALFVSSTAVLRAGIIRLPLHGSGNLGLIQDQGRLIATFDMDQQNNLGLPASGANALFQFSGAGTAGSRVTVHANSQANHYNGPFATFTSTTDVVFGGDITNYRGTSIETATANTRLRLDQLSMTGVAGPTGTALSLAGTLTDFTLSNFDCNSWVTCITGTPTVAGSMIANNVVGGATTANTTNISAGTIPLFTSVNNLFGQSIAGPLTVGTLPAGQPAGSIRYVNDADACTYGSAPIHTTGTTFCKVVYDGSAWIAN